MKLSRTAIVSAAYLVFILLNWFSDWLILRISDLHLVPNFNDLRLVLASSDCASGFGYFTFSENISKACNYNYGFSLIRFFHVFGIKFDHANVIGFLFLTLMISILVLIHLKLGARSVFENAIIFLILMSPISAFLIERANFDILIFAFVVVGSLLISGSKTNLGLLAIFIASLIKFYTLPLLFLVFLFKSSLFNRLFGLFLFLLGTSVAVHDIRLIQAGLSFPRNCSASFGNPVLFVCFREAGIDIPNQIQNVLGIFLFIIVSLILFNLNFKETYSFKIYRRISLIGRKCDVLFISTGFTFLICFFSSVNVDYRLIFLAYPALKEILTCRETKRRIFLFSMLILAFWFGDNAFFLQPLGDLAILFWASQLTIKLMIALGLLRSKGTVKS
jgi:hypothetical protein